MTQKISSHSKRGPAEEKKGVEELKKRRLAPHPFPSEVFFFAGGIFKKGMGVLEKGLCACVCVCVCLVITSYT